MGKCQYIIGEKRNMAKILGAAMIILGLLMLSLLFSTDPALIFGSASIGFGLGCLVWN